jgi:DNA-binding GntR family transcriptional regulator
MFHKKRKNMNAPSPILRKESLTDLVVDYLKQGILDGKFRPGHRLVEREICESLNVSRSSVREAMRTLEADKLIHREHYRGPVVACISYEDALELYAYRSLLEGFATYEFTNLAKDQELEKLTIAMKKLHAESAKGDFKQVLAAVTEIYDVIFTGCRNKLIKEGLLKLMDRINLLRLTSMTQPNRIAISLQEMDLMHQHIMAREAEAAKQAAIVHVQEAAKVALAVLEKAQNPS